MSIQYLLNLHSARRPRHIGNKANKLRFLIRRGFQTPTTYVCTWDAYLRYLQDDREMIGQVKRELSGLIDPQRRYAVRSSANVEDDLAHSFAGQFKSVLDAQGPDEIMSAMWSIWASTRSPGVETYLEKLGLDPDALKMALMIQEMVPPVVSGVAFSKNPLTGMDEIVIEAVRGSGVALLQEGVTPGRWIYKWGAWIAQPDPAQVPLDIIQEVVTQTQTIAQAYGAAIDLEWVYDGKTIYWVQLREITALDDLNIYSNHISKEYLPGLIKPLVWSVNMLVNAAWLRLITEVIGPNDFYPAMMAKSFYYRAYFNMGAFGQIFDRLGMPRESLELLMGIELGGPNKPSFKPGLRAFRRLPRLLYVALDKLRFARQIKTFVPLAQRRYQAFHDAPISQMNETELLDEIEALYRLTEETAYYNVVTPLLMQLYNRLLESQLRQVGVHPAQFNVTAGLSELEAFDPNVHLSRLHRDYRALDPTAQTSVQSTDSTSSTSGDEAGFFQRDGHGTQAFQGDVAEFIARFGHLSDSGNDFSSVPWRETPGLILKMVAHYVPPERPAAEKQRFETLPLSPTRRLLLRPLYRRARQFRLYREAISFLYTLGYGLFRPYFLALGDHLARRGLIADREDIFYLYFDEIRAAVRDPTAGQDAAPVPYAQRVAQRQREIEAYRDVTPPNIVYGDTPVPLESHSGGKLKGTPTSRGYYQGPARVIRGIQDFDKLIPGDVLVIPYSDAGWTPLFTKAGAVIAESGGMLSHSSIVAREYGIPAVVSVPGACQLEDGTLVTVDGYKGHINVHSPERSS
jgi:phosphohistidine swiveling domain-containing protein